MAAEKRGEEMSVKSKSAGAGMKNGIIRSCGEAVHKLLWFIKLCGMTLSMCWRGYISYMGWSALVHGIGLIVGYLGEYTVLYTMIMNFPGLDRFTALDICFLYAMGLVAYALGNLHTREFWNMDELVLRGRLDLFLVRPASPLVQLFVQDIQVGYLSHLILGIGSMMLVKGMAGISWDAAHWALFVLSLLAGGLVMGGISLLPAPLSFWWGRSRSVTGFVRWDMKEAIKYPVTIYPQIIRRMLFLIPYAFVSYYPCLYLLGKDTSPGAFLYPICTLAAGIGVNAVFYVFWRLGLRRYNSAGG